MFNLKVKIFELKKYCQLNIFNQGLFFSIYKCDVQSAASMEAA